MRIALLALGTRGDVQPMIALSKGLQSVGHEVVLIAGSNFADWVASHGLAFRPSIDMEALMNSEKALSWTENSDNQIKQIAMMRELMNEYGESIYAPLPESIGSADLIISGFVTETFVQAISEKTAVPYINVLLQPQRATRSGTASINRITARSSILNLWMGQFVDRILWSISGPPTNRLRTERLQLPPHTVLSYTRARSAAPTLLGFSRHVVPMPADWSENMIMTGYWFLDEEKQWQPSPQLTMFLKSTAPTVYIGFGSMSSREPQQTLDLIVSAVQRTGLRAIVSAGGANINTADLPGTVLAVSGVPHTWLFSQITAVVHHGGAGTTAAGLYAGKPTMVIPHLGDQPFWGRRTYELGVGVQPVPRQQLTADALAKSLEQLVRDTSMRTKAEALGEKIRAERGVEQAVEAVERWARSLNLTP